MQLSTKGRYALKAMADMALNDNGEYISLKDIANRQDIPLKYLEQIVSILNKAGFLKSLRGAQGGYRLAMKPSEYTVGMVLRLTEGIFAPDRDRSDSTIVDITDKLDAAINSVLDSITLEDVATKERDKWVNDYCI